MTSLYWLCISLVVGGVGGILFATGLLVPIDYLVAAGVGLICASIVGLLVNYVYCLKPMESVQTQQTQQTQSERPRYSTNSMNVVANTMKRNKSDTDLELINKQTEAAESDGIV